MYATDVIYATWTMQTNKTITILDNGTNVDPGLPKHAWTFAEMKTVHEVGVIISMGLRDGFTYFNDNLLNLRSVL